MTLPFWLKTRRPEPQRTSVPSASSMGHCRKCVKGRVALLLLAFGGSMLLRKSIAAGVHTPQDGGTVRSHRATRLGEGGEGQTTTSLPPPPPPESLTGAWPPGTTWIQTPEGWVPNWPDDVPSGVATDATHAATAAGARQLGSPNKGGARHAEYGGGGTASSALPKSQDSLGGAAKTHRPRVTAKAGSNHGSPERGRRLGQPGPTETEGATLTPGEKMQKHATPAAAAATSQPCSRGTARNRKQPRCQDRAANKQERGQTAHNQPLPPYHSESRQYRTTAHPKSKQQSTVTAVRPGRQQRRPTPTTRHRTQQTSSHRSRTRS